MTGTLIALLAAGASSRMRGGDKLLEEVEGRPLLRVLADRALATGLAVAVTLPPDRPARAAALAGSQAIALTVSDASSGMAASFRKIAATAAGRAVLVMLADMPEIDTADLQRLLAAGSRAARRIVRATAADGRPGQPVLFPAQLVPEMAGLRGDAGARALLAGRDAVACPLPGRRALVDLDTPEDWAAWRAR